MGMHDRDWYWEGRNNKAQQPAPETRPSPPRKPRFTVAVTRRQMDFIEFAARLALGSLYVALPVVLLLKLISYITH